MPSKNNKPVVGSQTDSGIDIDDTISPEDIFHIRAQVDKIKYKRSIKREADEANFRDTFRVLQGRIEKQHAVRSKKAEMERSQLLANLTRAMEKRFELEKAIGAKLVEVQQEFETLANLLESAYDGRLEKLRKATLPAQQLPRDK